ncbi:hypothetical protein [Providencia sp. Me31A]|uniref:hypothetical protein n=1 Tax=Providencia sp. Me31A TaxID=3392637 RepID=UPI003D2BF992
MRKNEIPEKSHLIEQQEFLNLFFPVSLQVIETPHSNNVQYIFILSNFAAGIRDIEYTMVREFLGQPQAIISPINLIKLFIMRIINIIPLRINSLKTLIAN